MLSTVRTSATRVSGLCLRRLNLICRDAAQISSEPNFRERPDKPLGGIKLPWLHPIPVVMLKLVVIVMVPFAHGEKGKEERVTRGAFF